jgi:hypothetical protein
MGRVHRLLYQACGVAIALFYLAFVARTGVDVGGKTYFALWDDGMISMTYARNLADGHGLVWNPGEPAVEGYTNFLWVVWMAVIHLFPFPEAWISLVVVVTGAALLVGTALLAGRISASIAHTRGPSTGHVAAAAALATAAFYPLAYWALRGTEVSLLAFLLLLSIWAAFKIEKGEGGLGLLALSASAAVLTRTDAIVLLAPVLAYAVYAAPAIARRRVALTLALVVGSVFVAHEAFRYTYYGDLLPNTYYMRVGGLELAERLTRGVEVATTVTALGLYAPLLVVGMYAAQRRSRIDRRLMLLVVIFLTQLAYRIYVGGGIFRHSDRYLTPAVVPLIVAAVACAAVLAHHHISRRAAAGWALAAVGVAVLVFEGRLPGAEQLGPRALMWSALPLAFALVPVVVSLRPQLALAAAALGVVAATSAAPMMQWARDNGVAVEFDKIMVRYGVALRQGLTPQTTVAVTAAGAPIYFGHVRGVDLFGKSDPEIAHSRPRNSTAPGENKWDFKHSLGRLRPDFIAQLPGGTATPEIESFARWGYVPIGNSPLEMSIVTLRQRDLEYRDEEALLRFVLGGQGP